MKVPFIWLRDYVDVGNLSPKDVAERLTFVGLEVVLIERVGNDSVFDIEVTPNRPDCLSIVGVAREASSALQKRLKAPKIKPIKAKLKEKVAVEIKDKALCRRYTTRLIRNVKVGPSPKWLAEKLEKVDLRPVNNVVDITNLCLFELGQPTHAFDYDKIKGKIIVRRAQKGEKIVTIDGRERTLEADTLIIADEERPIAIAGVMGSKDTEVTESTKDILFESAYFDPISVRRTSRSLGLVSESSYRFERSVDMGGIVETSNRACSLILQLCGGKCGPLADVGEKTPKRVKIYLRPQRLKDVLGLDIPPSNIKRILSSLALDIELAAKDTMVVSIPTFRQDLNEEIDLIEEVIRIYGYDRLPSTMPAIVGHPKRIEPSRELSNVIRDTLISLGIDEVITYSLISKEDLAGLEEVKDDKVIVIKNPLSIEQEIMRPSLAAGILHAASWNLNRNAKGLKIFELGRVYTKDTKGFKEFKEEDSLAIAFVGTGSFGWHGKTEDLLFNAKGTLEALFQKLALTKVLFKSEGLPAFLTEEAASIWLGKDRIGFVGKIDTPTLDRFDIKSDIILCEMSLEELYPHIKLDKRFREIPRFPSVVRDISFVIEKRVSHQDITKTMREVGGDLIADIGLFDQYFGAQIPPGHRGLAYSIEYRAKDRTLTDEEVNGVHSRICETLVQRFGARIR